MSDENTSSGQDIELHVKAGSDILSMLLEHYFDKNVGKIHAETVLSAASVLMDEWSLVSLGQPLPEKGWVVSSGANEIMIEGDEPLLEIVRKTAISLGLEEAELPDPVEVVARTVAAFGSSYPPYSMPRKHQPNEWSMFAGPRFREQVRAIAESHGLTVKDIPLACTIAICSLMQMVAKEKVLDLKTTIALVYENAIAAARMAPMSPEFAEELMNDITEKQV